MGILFFRTCMPKPLLLESLLAVSVSETDAGLMLSVIVMYTFTGLGQLIAILKGVVPPVAPMLFNWDEGMLGNCTVMLLVFTVQLVVCVLIVDPPMYTS